MRSANFRTAVFGLAVAGGLIFGAAQAFASPGEKPARMACSLSCESQCGPLGGVVMTHGRCLCCG